MNLDELKVSFSHRTIIRTQDVNKSPEGARHHRRWNKSKSTIRDKQQQLFYSRDEMGEEGDIPVAVWRSKTNLRP